MASQLVRLVALLLAVLAAVPAAAQTAAGLRVQVASEEADYYQKAAFAFYLRADADAYAYVFVTEADGVVRQVFPNRYDKDNLLKAGATRRVPEAGYRMEIEGPAGAGELFAIACTEPLPTMQAEYGPLQTFREPYPRVWAQPRTVYDGMVQQAGSAGKPLRYGWASWRFRVSAPPSGPYYYDRDERLTPPPTPVDTDNQSWREEYRRSGRARLRITSEPDEAEIFIDGKSFGETPRTINLDAGDHSIRVERRRYNAWERDVDLEAGTMKTFNITLKRQTSSSSSNSNSGNSSESWGPVQSRRY